MVKNSLTCETCGKNYGSAMALMAHSRVHKEKTPETEERKEPERRKKESANSDFFIEDDSQSLNPLYEQNVRDREDKKVYYHVDGKRLELKHASIEGSYFAEDPKTGLIVYFPPGTLSAAKITLMLNGESNDNESNEEEEEPETEKANKFKVEDDRKPESEKNKTEYRQIGLFKIAQPDTIDSETLSKEEESILNSEPIEEHHGFNLLQPLFPALYRSRTIDEKRDLVIKAQRTAKKHPDWSEERIINTFWDPDDRKIIRDLIAKGIKLRKED